MGLTDAQIETLNKANLGFLVTEIQQTQHDADAQWLLYASALVFFMQTGFAMLCAGLVRAKNTKNILLKNVLDACAGALGFWSLGYGFAYGVSNGGNPFIGNDSFFLYDFQSGKYGLEFWFFQFAFAATGATIVSGAVAERTRMSAYLGYSTVLTMFVYPVVVHWQWSSQGWLSPFRTPGTPFLGVGMIDFAGCGAVHMVGGLSALLGAFFVGPRLGRFDAEGNVIDIPGHSATLQALGTFILWVGWYGFNPGSALGIIGLGKVVSLAAATTTIAAAAGAITNLALAKLILHNLDLLHTLNGALAGLVSITAGCATVDPWSAVPIGMVGACVYTAWASFVRNILKVDDVVDASAVHFACGAWGLISAALFSRQSHVQEAYGQSQYYGAFFGGGGELLACAVVGILSIIGWVVAIMAPFFLLLKQLNMLRSPPEHEEVGLDVSKHGGEAYPDYMARPPRENSHRSYHPPSGDSGTTPKSIAVQPATDEVRPVSEGETGD